MEMATAEAAQVISLPLPPSQYINLYTDENVKKNRAPRPPPTIQDTYSMFGNTFNNDDNIIRPLESQGFKRLYPQHCDRRKELKKLNHSLFVNFLDLIDLLIHCPDSPRRTEKVEDLNLLFVHIHHLLNEFRPHQARETLRVMMEMQKRQRHETVQRFQRHLEKVREIVKTTFAALPDSVNSDNRMNSGDDLMDIGSDDHKDGAGEDGIYPNDRLMCSIVDDII